MDWRVAARIVTYHRVKWANDSLGLIKAQVCLGYSRPYYKRGGGILISYLVRIFHACLVTGYVPAMWHQVKVVFIPKPGRSSYCGPRYFRPSASHRSY